MEDKTLIELGEQGLLTQKLAAKPIDRAEPQAEVKYEPKSPFKTLGGLVYLAIFGVCGLLAWALLVI